ncbi:MAG: hypothetical protein FJX75_21010 [Armatimonadetes bacterium]|nr:hypothetical protein [Armatimonadota bacterium]
MEQRCGDGLRRLVVLSCLLAVGCLSGAQADALKPPPVPASLRLPTYQMPEPNGYEALEAVMAAQGDGPPELYDLCDKVLRREVASPAEADLQQASALVEQFRPSLDAVPKLLDMEWLYPRQATPGTIYPELSRTRKLVYVLAVRSVLEEQAGEPDRAARTLLSGLRLAAKLPRGGTFYSWSTGRGCEAVCILELRPLLASGKLSRETLLSVRDTMSALRASRVPLREMIAYDYDSQSRGALTLSAKEFWELLGGPPNTFLPLDDPKADALARKFIIERLPPLMAYDGRMAELATQPYWQARPKVPDLPPGLPQPDEGLVFLPVPGGVLRNAARSACDCQATETMVALELTRQARGAYPQSLAEVEGLAKADLTDPLSGKPLVYKPTGDTYVLYSVSIDGVDNGGHRGAGYPAPFEEGGDYLLWDGTQAR